MDLEQEAFLYNGEENRLGLNLGLRHFFKRKSLWQAPDWQRNGTLFIHWLIVLSIRRHLGCLLTGFDGIVAHKHA